MEHAVKFDQPVNHDRHVEIERKGSAGFEAVISGRTDLADISDLNFDAVELYRLSGKVLHRGKPLAGATVEGEALGRLTTDSDGFFSFDNIEDGTTYSLTVSKEKFRFDNGRSKGVVSKDATVSFEAVKLVTIKGRIIHKGAPLAGVLVDGGPLGTTVTSEDGIYQFVDVPENTEYTIKASKPGYKLR